MTKSITIAAAISIMATMTLTATAQAHERHEYSHQRYARVIRVVPVTRREVMRTAPRQICRTEDLRRKGRGNGLGSALIGAVVGGVVGNQFGGGNGRAATTALGAVAGAAIGQRIGQNDFGAGQRQVAYRQVCHTVPGERRVRRSTDYRVTYLYHGRIHHTTLPYPPHARLRVPQGVRPR